MYIVESVQKIRDELSGGVAWGAVPAIRELGSVSKCTLTTDIKFHTTCVYKPGEYGIC